MCIKIGIYGLTMIIVNDFAITKFMLITGGNN